MKPYKDQKTCMVNLTKLLDMVSPSSGWYKYESSKSHTYIDTHVRIVVTTILSVFAQ